MARPIGEIWGEACGAGDIEKRILCQRQFPSPLERVGGFAHAPVKRVLHQAGGPRLVEPLLERAALVGPAIVVIRRRHNSKASRQMRRRGDGGQHLRGAHVRSAEHADFAIRIRQRRGPFDGVVAVLAMMLERNPSARGGKTAAHILHDDDVAERSGSCTEIAAGLVVGRAREQHGKLAIGLGPVNIGTERDTVARFHGDAALDGHFIGTGGNGSGCEQEKTDGTRAIHVLEYREAMKLLQLLLLLASALPATPVTRHFYDRKHFSKVLGEERTYRILLPPDYEASGKLYPVIYYFHGHSDRYALEKDDNGTDTIPKMADFVAHHDAIVVSVDGYVARDYTGFYGGTPWDVMQDGGDYAFGQHFTGLVAPVAAPL